MNGLEVSEVSENMYIKARQSELWSGYGHEIFKNIETSEIIISDFGQLMNCIPVPEGWVKIGELDELKVEDMVTCDRDTDEDYEFSEEDYRNVIDWIKTEADEAYEAPQLSDDE